MTRGERRKEKVRQAINHNAQLRKNQLKGLRLEEAETDFPDYRQHVSPRKWREQQERKLADCDIEICAREKCVVEAELSAIRREKIACQKECEAILVLAVAQAVADGDLSGLKPEPMLGEDETSPPAKRTLARRLFQRAIDRLRTEQRSEARSELAGGFVQIRRADDAIVNIANLLPPGLRRQVASARKSLTNAIASLGRRIDASGKTEAEEPRHK